MAQQKTKAEGAKGKGKKPTQYHVLRLVAARELVDGGPEEIGPERWEFIATVSATSDAAAKMAVFKTAAVGDGEIIETLVAVPTRSWHPKRHRTVNQPRFIVE